MTQSKPRATIFGDDLRVGECTDLGRYTLSAGDIRAFAQEWDPQFFHIDAQRAATEGYFGGLIASGIQTLAVFQRLTVENLIERWAVIGGAGISDLRFVKPVRPGDTLAGSARIEDVTLQPERRRARVVYAGELINQNAARVLTLTMAVYVRLRAE